MGNCIGKKSNIENKYRKHTSSIVSTHTFKSDKQCIKTSSQQLNHCISNVDKSKILSKNNEHHDLSFIKNSSSILTDDNNQLLSIHPLLTFSSSVPSSIECKTVKSNDLNTKFNENNIQNSIRLKFDQQTINIDHEINKENEIDHNDEQILLFNKKLTTSKTFLVYFIDKFMVNSIFFCFY